MTRVFYIPDAAESDPTHPPTTDFEKELSLSGQMLAWLFDRRARLARGDN